MPFLLNVLFSMPSPLSFLTSQCSLLSISSPINILSYQCLLLSMSSPINVLSIPNLLLLISSLFFPLNVFPFQCFPFPCFHYQCFHFQCFLLSISSPSCLNSLNISPLSYFFSIFSTHNSINKTSLAYQSFSLYTCSFIFSII